MKHAALLVSLLLGAACGGEATPPAATAPAPEPAFWLEGTRVLASEGIWTLDLVVDLASPPPPTQVPFRFELDMRVLYEPVEGRGRATYRALPVKGDPTLYVTRDVCFASQRATRFRLPLTLEERAGFSAGEYALRLVRLDTGVMLGEERELVLYTSGASLR
jgi:hypothetical protein